MDEPKYYAPLLNCSCCDEEHLATSVIDGELYFTVSTFTELELLDENNENSIIGWKPLDNLHTSYIKELAGDTVKGVLLYTPDETVALGFKDKEDSESDKEPYVKNPYVKEPTTLDNLIENKLVKNIFTEIELYGLSEFIYTQFEDQFNNSSENFGYAFCDTYGVFGLFIYDDCMPCFDGTDIFIKSVFIGSDNRTLYFLTVNDLIYSYKMEDITSCNKNNKYPA